ncbi:site-specific recombinase, phage integrase family [Oesophagostomum dentatum]|uniref:Site-specific recombinase, phage integrase family n=1 Tax=Oesophagostomum dentatum TaxID=61180 RepID=A0A0B1RV10_OESDE|nr:site-specific recombinase, phage integrase family [Oesophagostomum dentatum]
MSMPSIPLPKARNLYLAKCAHDGKQKSLPVIVSALNYFCGPLTGVDSDIQHSILEAEKRSAPSVTHRAKIDQGSMRQLVLKGLDAPNPKLEQAATLALLQFKALLRISEAQALRGEDLEHKGGEVYSVFIRKSKTDQHRSGTVSSFRLDSTEAQLLKSAFYLPVIVYKEAPYLFYAQGQTKTSFQGMGGAASLALNSGVDQIAVMQAGRWKSLKSFRCYIAPKPLCLPTDPHEP